MKSRILLSTLLLFLAIANCDAQTYMKTWYFSPNKVDMTAPAPSITTITGASTPVSEVANGAYDRMDPYGDAMFYITDDQVFDKNNNVIGVLSTIPQRTSEIAVTPVPDYDKCTNNKYLIIYNSPNPVTAAADIRYNVVDMSANGGLGWVSPPTTILSVPNAEFAGIAVGLKAGSRRNLYVCGGSPWAVQRIFKVEINNGPTFTTTQLFSGTGFDFETSELDINKDETMLAFASSFVMGQLSTNRYHIFELATNTLTAFNVGTDNSTGLRGVEFYRKNSQERLLVGAGSDGLFEINPSNPNSGQSQIPGSGIYGRSQIEMGYNGMLYAGSVIDIGAINPIPTITTMSPANNIATIAPSTIFTLAGTTPFYTLPDQIDFEDYNNLFAREQNTLDLYIKDNYRPNHVDIGVEPNPDMGMMWVSGDIIARRSNTPGSDQTLEWTSNPSVYSYILVTVRNESCVDYVGGGEVFLNWTKASTTMRWPDDWFDATTSTMICAGQSLPLGGEVYPDDKLTLPAIPAQSSTVLSFRWHIPVDPTLFQPCFAQSEYMHHCLIARIVEPLDPDPGLITQFVYSNTRENNNWAWKNISIENAIPGMVHGENCFDEQKKGTGVVIVCNPGDENDSYTLEFKIDEANEGIPLFEQAEIIATLDDVTWEKWLNGGQQGENIQIYREDCKQIQINGSPAFLYNLFYEGKQKSLMALNFNFISEKIDDKLNFEYNLIQRRSENHSIIGGELYRIKKPIRTKFSAEGGEDKKTAYAESTQIDAESIGEPAYYNWYDETGTLIYSGQNLTVNPEVTTKYKLQVIAKNDGFVSYDEVVVQVMEYQIKSISPNPATTALSVDYFIKDATNAYLTVCPFNSTSSSNYIIDPLLINTSINLSGMGTGSYYLRLVVDGEIKDEVIFVIVQ